MYTLSNYTSTWQNGCRQGGFLLVGLLLVLTLLRVFFLGYFGDFATMDLSEAFAALWMGFRVDLKWSLLLLLPAWILWVLGFFFSFFRDFAKLFVIVAVLLMSVFGVVNIAFYAFYHTPISSIIFGLWQDDTRAIMETIWSDWPVLQLIALCIGLTLVPILFAWLGKSRSPYATEFRWGKGLITIFLCSVLIVLGIRGSFGKFPLRLQDWAVTTDGFLNNAVPNGVASFWEAIKEQRMLTLKGGVNEGVKNLGFDNLAEAQDVLKRAGQKSAFKAMTPAPEFVVFCLMESMGRDEFESDRPGENDTLGALRDVLPSAQVFRHGIAVEGGTFPSLEGLLFDTPITPISQSRYGDKSFPFSRLWDYKKAGYETIFLTAGSVSWRQLDRHFLRQGFDRVLGDKDILEKFPKAEHGTWGVGDQWMFKYATDLLAEKAKKGEKVFLFMLSTTNHPPHQVPDGEKVNPVDPNVLSDFIVDDRKDPLVTNRLQTYQYSANALGQFVERLQASGLANKSVVVATGDHNSRQHYVASGYWHHGNGVPILFWLPENTLKAPVDANRWVSHRDIFPTLNALVLGKASQPYDGRNLFTPEDIRPAISYATLDKYGLALGPFGAVSIGPGGALTCYRWEDDKLLAEWPCSETNLKVGQIAKAQRAVRDYIVRDGLLNNPESTK